MALLPVPGLTRDSFAERLHISFSALTTFLTCPRRYRYHYVEGQPREIFPSALAFGRAIHRAVAWFYEQISETGVKPPVADMVMRFQTYWKEESDAETLTYKEKESFEALLAKGTELVEVFWLEQEPQKIEAVEYPFSVDLVDPVDGENLGYQLVGVFDLLESDKDGNLIISELKTSGRRQDEDTIRNNLQAAVYSYALKRLGFTTTQKKTLIRLDILLKTKKPEMQQVFLTKGDEDHQRIVNLAKHILRAIDMGIFYPNYGWWCGECPFKKRCSTDLS